MSVCTRGATDAAQLAVDQEHLRRSRDASRDAHRRGRLVTYDVGSQRLEITQRAASPFQPHPSVGGGSSVSVPQQRSQAATLSCGTDSPGSASASAKANF